MGMLFYYCRKSTTVVRTYGYIINKHYRWWSNKFDLSLLRYDAPYQTWCVPYTHYCTSQRVYAWTILTTFLLSTTVIPYTALYITTYLCLDYTTHNVPPINTIHTTTQHVYLQRVYAWTILTHNVPPINHDPYHLHSTIHHNIYAWTIHTQFILLPTDHTSAPLATYSPWSTIYYKTTSSSLRHSYPSQEAFK